MTELTKRGRTWLSALTADTPTLATGLDSLLGADAMLDGELTRFIAVIPDPKDASRAHVVVRSASRRVGRSPAAFAR